MQIWTSCIGQRLDDAENTRTMLLAEHLVRRGHQVTLWTSAFDHIRKQWRVEWLASQGDAYQLKPGLTVRFMKGIGYRNNISVRRLIDHLLAARDFSRQAALLPIPDAVIASMPDHATASAVIQYAVTRDIVGIVDVRDKWPDIFVDYAPGRVAKALVKLSLARESRRAQRALAGADALVAMMQSMLLWGLAKAARASTNKDRVFYLTTMDKNVGSPEELEVISSDLRNTLNSLEGRIVLTFVGTFNRTQHPLLIIEALDVLKQDTTFEMDKIAILIGGQGIGTDAFLKRIGAHPNVHYLGWLRPQEMNAVLSRSDIGLLPLNFTSPAFNNKAFAYLASGLPIINGASGDLADLIAADGLGCNVEAGCKRSLAAAIKAMCGSRSALSQMKARTRAVFAERFDREKNYQSYVDHVEALVREKHPA